MRQTLMVKQGFCCRSVSGTLHYTTSLYCGDEGQTEEGHSRVKLNVLVLIKVLCCGIETCTKALNLQLFLLHFQSLSLQTVTVSDSILVQGLYVMLGLETKPYFQFCCYCILYISTTGKKSYSDPITRIYVSNVQFSRTRDKRYVATIHFFRLIVARGRMLCLCCCEV